jgi:hypothetical protein
MSRHAQKFLPPFDWTQFDPLIQTQILGYATRKFVMEWMHENHRQTLCFERPIHPKLLEPTQLTITFTNQRGPQKWTNVLKFKVQNAFAGRANETSGWRFRFHCANRPGVPEIYITGNFTREALIRGLTESLHLNHKELQYGPYEYGQDEFSI